MENNSAKPKVHGLITSSGNQLYLNPFQHHSPTVIVCEWKQTLHRSSSRSPPLCPHPNPSSASQWSLFVSSFWSALSSLSLSNHHFHSFWYCSLQDFCDLQYLTLTLLSWFHSQLCWFPWCQLPVLCAPFLWAALLFLILCFLTPSSDPQDGIPQCWLSSPHFLFVVLPCCWDPHQEMCAKEGRTWEEGAAFPLALALALALLANLFL